MLRRLFSSMKRVFEDDEDDNDEDDVVVNDDAVVDVPKEEFETFVPVPDPPVTTTTTTKKSLRVIQRRRPRPTPIVISPTLPTTLAVVMEQNRLLQQEFVALRQDIVQARATTKEMAILKSSPHEYVQDSVVLDKWPAYDMYGNRIDAPSVTKRDVVREVCFLLFPPTGLLGKQRAWPVWRDEYARRDDRHAIVRGLTMNFWGVGWILDIFMDAVPTLIRVFNWPWPFSRLCDCVEGIGRFTCAVLFSGFCSYALHAWFAWWTNRVFYSEVLMAQLECESQVSCDTEYRLKGPDRIPDFVVFSVGTFLSVWIGGDVNGYTCLWWFASFSLLASVHDGKRLFTYQSNLYSLLVLLMWVSTNRTRRSRAKKNRLQLWRQGWSWYKPWTWGDWMDESDPEPDIPISRSGKRLKFFAKYAPLGGILSTLWMYSLAPSYPHLTRCDLLSEDSNDTFSTCFFSLFARWTWYVQFFLVMLRRHEPLFNPALGFVGYFSGTPMLKTALLFLQLLKYVKDGLANFSTSLNIATVALNAWWKDFDAKMMVNETTTTSTSTSS